jgi:hypothetical protein
MIIGINGKIGSGKDTIGGIIQYLTSDYKDKYDYKNWIDRVENHGSNTYSPWEIKKFAGKLKQTGSLLTGIPIEKFEDQEFKKTELAEDWNYFPIIGYGHRNVPVYGQDEQAMLVREFLQKLGTEAMRDGLHTNVWVNALFADYKPTNDCQQHADGLFYTDEHGENEVIPEYPNWIITDMRFPNELEAVVKREGLTIRVVRPGTSVGTHPSETALDDAEFDYEIINDGSIADLIDKVIDILTLEKLI